MIPPTAASPRDNRPVSEHLAFFSPGGSRVPGPGAPLAPWAIHRFVDPSYRSMPMSSLFRRLSILFLLVLGSLASGCDSFLFPDEESGVDEESLDVVHVGPDAPPLVSTDVTFWIVGGEAAEVEIRYQTAGYIGKCLRLVIPAEAQVRRPNGTLLEPGDSVLATIRVIDPARFVFEMLPEGLTFGSANPARLEIHYQWMADDTNGDGKVDAADSLLASRFGVWSRNTETGRWSAVPSVRQGDQNTIEAPVTRFTRYALASD
jgi:hypothetical protein